MERYRTDELLQQDLSSPDPFRRAGALFSGAQRGSIPRNRMQEISLNGTWPEKLALHYLFTVPDASSRQEHVCWLQPQDNIVAAGEMVPLSASHQEHIEQLRTTPNIGARIDSLSVWHEDGCPEEFDDYPVVLINCSQRSFVVSQAVKDFRGFRLVLPV